MQPRIERLYQQFARYPFPSNIWVCTQCGPEWSEESIRATPLRSLSLQQLTAVHVMALDDDSLKHFLPRLIELMLRSDVPFVEFRLADLQSRLPTWPPDEQEAVGQLAEGVWSELLHCYPCELGYFSECPSAVDFLAWCGLDLVAHLDSLMTVETPAAARHLAELIDVVFTTRDPFESSSKTTVLDWLRNPAIGERLQAAFFAADPGPAAVQLSNAHELWTVCAAP